MARKPAVEIAREWVSRAEEADPAGMASLLAEDALFYADLIRGRRFLGREAIEAFLAESGFEATGYTFTPYQDEYAVVSLSLRRHLQGGGLADSTIAMVFKTDGDEIVCLDVFRSADAAFASLRKS